MMRRHLSDRILSVCAVALLGSLALVPAQTLAHGSESGMAASPQGHRHDSRGDRGHDRDGSPASNHAGPGRTGACTKASDDRGNDACNEDQLRQGRGAAASAAKARPGAPGTATAGERGTPAGVATASSTSRVPAATGAVPTAHGVALTQGVNLPGTPVHISRPPASIPGGGRPAAVPPPVSAPPPRPVLGPVPVPVLVPSIGVTAPPAASALPWEWLIALAIVGSGLAGFFVARRRRAGSGPL
jgi:hypothetical protein